MSTPEDLRRAMLQGLYDATAEGIGTDLEVLIPTRDVGGTALCPCSNDSKRQQSSFNLHQLVVAQSSRYFATFPEPKMGRVIDDVDAASFSACVKFMYLGESDGLSRDTAAGILHASDLLQIDRLKAKCVEYLEQRLDHSNYEQVVELADRYDCQDLRKAALRFQSEDSARDALVAKKVALVQDITTAKHEEKEIQDRKKRLEKGLVKIDAQLKSIFQKQHEEALSAKWEERAKNDDDDGIPFAMGVLKKKGAIGHLVVPVPQFYPDGTYEGSSTYGDEVSSDAEFFDVGSYPPPPPTTEQYEKYGIVNTHGSIKTALEAANDGDRIYFAEGIHRNDEEWFQGDMGVRVDKSIEFIGLGDTSRVVVEVEGGEDQYFLVENGYVGFFNITFRSKKGNGGPFGEYRNAKNISPGTQQGTADDAMITFGDGFHFNVKNCVFDLGVDDKAYRTRVSGILLKRGKSLAVEGCKFIGGAGSAITVVNDPHLYTPNVEIVRNSFVSNGQPTFSEICKKQVRVDKKLTYVPLPSREITPGPASVELWFFDRPCYKIYGETEKHSTMAVNVEGNKFQSNLRAPLAYRVIVPKSTDKNDWHLFLSPPAETAKGFDLKLLNNVMKSNGLQFDTEAMRAMLFSDEQKEKKPRTKTDDQSENLSFPDGDSLLVIHHNFYDSFYQHESFPHGWKWGEPYDGYLDEHGVTGDY
ncbi:hypothetical protein ACHAXT_008624 [Thalassiosira profunda]